MSNFEILPYQGVNELKFGMTREEVTRLLGPPSRTRTSRFSRDRIDAWLGNGLQLTFERGSGRLAEVALYSGVGDVVLQGLSLFSMPAAVAFDRLVALDGDPKEALGVTVMLNLGIAVTGFVDDDAGQKSVTAFCRGRWDDPSLGLHPLARPNQL